MVEYLLMVNIEVQAHAVLERIPSPCLEDANFLQQRVGFSDMPLVPLVAYILRIPRQEVRVLIVKQRLNVLVPPVVLVGSRERGWRIEGHWPTLPGGQPTRTSKEFEFGVVVHYNYKQVEGKYDDVMVCFVWFGGGY